MLDYYFLRLFIIDVRVELFFKLSLFVVAFCGANFSLCYADETNKNNKNSEKVHIVQPNENIYRISLKYHISQKELIEMNNIKDNNIRVGQKLLLPATAVFDDEAKNSANNSEKTSAINSDKDAFFKDNENLKKAADTKNIKTQNLVNQIDGTTFIWPVRGTILTKFGHQVKSGKLEGVNIGCENGTVVRASSSGRVVFNDKVDGFGNVILIRHYNGFFTAYGYTDPLVAVNDVVKKGQIIANVSKSSKSRRSIVYFSIRKNQKSYDPEKLIQTKITN